jgi:hypothetical protein
VGGVSVGSSCCFPLPLTPCAAVTPPPQMQVLDCFDDAGERANVLHRLGLQETAEGELAPARKR